MIETINKLIHIHSPSGSENLLGEAITETLTPKICEMDFMGNLTCRVEGEGTKVLIVSSMDEPSLVATYIESDGFIRFYPSGNLSISDIIGRQIIFPSGISGYVGVENDMDIKEITGFDKLFIDIGTKNKKQSAEFVNIGDHTSFNIPTRAEGNTILGRDDLKLPIAVSVTTANEVGQTQNNLVFTYTVQDKIGGRGAVVVTNKENPDLIINLCTVAATDTPTHKQKGNISIGAGPVLIADGSEIMRHYGTNNLIKEIAGSSNIPLQITVSNGLNITEQRMNNTHAGIPLVTLAIPVRKYGKFGAIGDTRDAVDTSKLLTKILRKKLM
ncbi:MAG: hypothetical protein R2883_01805 [Caldisericia bacterium]